MSDDSCLRRPYVRTRIYGARPRGGNPCRRDASRKEVGLRNKFVDNRLSEVDVGNLVAPRLERVGKVAKSRERRPAKRALFGVLDQVRRLHQTRRAKLFIKANLEFSAVHGSCAWLTCG